MEFQRYLKPHKTGTGRVSNENYIPSGSTDLPRRRSSVEEGNGTPSYYSVLKSRTKFMGPKFNREVIPIIRKLTMTNPDVGLALFDAVQLTNTGFRVKFDPGVKQEQVKKMRKHLNSKARTWGYGNTGLHELVNKFIRQAYVAGAISHEWVIAQNKKGIKDLVIVNPESIDFGWKNNRWVPYQRVKSDGINESEKLIRLNDFTFKYHGLNSDSNLPYGIPPYLNVMDSVARQLNMNKNIDYVMNQMGLLGFLEALVTKPDMQGDEGIEAYKARLTKLLADTKKNSEAGFKDGLVVGFKDDHEFNFHSTTQHIDNVDTVLQHNGIQTANGLKTPPVFLGIPVSGSESGMSVTFTKLLSQLTNVQETVGLALSYGLSLELRLAGFNFDFLNVEFNPSTITDDLKFQQSQEIKIRNKRQLRIDGIIGQDQYADELGYEAPYSQEPEVPWDQQVGGGSPSDEEKDRKDKEDKSDKSDRKSRDKKKTQPKRRDRDTKER